MTRASADLKLLLQKPRLERSDVLALFSRMRILMEENGLQGHYPQLNLYCNWCLHPTLSASPACLELLEQLTAHFVDSDGDPNVLTSRIYELTSIEKVRQQGSELLKKFGLLSIIFDNERNWSQISAVLMTILTDVPIEWPKESELQLKRNKRFKEIHDRAQLKAKGTKLFIRRFEFTVYQNKLCWKVLATMDYVDIMGPLYRKNA